MALFGKKKKEESCCCGGDCNAESMATAENMKQAGAKVKILGTEGDKCSELEKSVRKALEQLNMETEIDHVTDYAQIASYGVMTTPALVIDSKVVSLGKVLSTEEAARILGNSGR